MKLIKKIVCPPDSASIRNAIKILIIFILSRFLLSLSKNFMIEMETFNIDAWIRDLFFSRQVERVNKRKLSMWMVAYLMML